MSKEVLREAFLVEHATYAPQENGLGLLDVEIFRVRERAKKRMVMGVPCQDVPILLDTFGGDSHPGGVDRPGGSLRDEMRWTGMGI